MRELARLAREYARTGGLDLLSAGIEVARELATQAYGKSEVWIVFVDFVGAMVGVYALCPDCTDEELEELFKWLGFEIEEGEDG